MIKKIVISPDNKKAAIDFFDDLAKRKAELQAKIEKKFSFKPSTKSTKKEN